MRGQSPLALYMAQRARSEFAQALAAVAAERGIEPSVVLESIKLAIVAAYRRDAREHGEEVSEEEEFETELNPDTGEARVYAQRDGKKTDVTPPGFGRIAAQTAKQVIRQKIREAERETVLLDYEVRVGQLVSGIILRFEGQDVKVDLGKTEAIMPHSERIPTERFESGQRLTFILKEIREGLKGRELVVSRAAPAFIQKLFEREVPELSNHSIEIRAIARDPGVRTKVAVASRTSGVDPVGSCVGQRGVRVQEVIKEVGGEKIDVIPYTDDPAKFIELALSPAQNLSIHIEKETKRATVTAPQDQLSLVIGKDGQNVRLAGELTGYTIDVVGAPGTTQVEEIEKKEAVTEDAVGDIQQPVTNDQAVDNEKKES